MQKEHRIKSTNKYINDQMLDQANNFLKRPIKKIQNLNKSLSRAYKKNFFKEPRFDHIKLLKKIRKRPSCFQDSITSQQNSDSSFQIQKKLDSIAENSEVTISAQTLLKEKKQVQKKKKNLKKINVQDPKESQSKQKDTNKTKCLNYLIKKFNESKSNESQSNSSQSCNSQNESNSSSLDESQQYQSSHNKNQRQIIENDIDNKNQSKKAQIKLNQQTKKQSSTQKIKEIKKIMNVNLIHPTKDNWQLHGPKDLKRQLNQKRDKIVNQMQQKGSKVQIIDGKPQKIKNKTHFFSQELVQDLSSEQQEYVELKEIPKKIRCFGKSFKVLNLLLQCDGFHFQITPNLKNILSNKQKKESKLS